MRKYILVTLSVILATSFIITGVSAFFSESTVSIGNFLTMGTLDLRIEGKDLDNSSEPLFNLSNLKPGSHGSKTVNISNAGNTRGDAVYVTLYTSENYENRCTEPEINDSGSNDDCSTNSEPELETGELCKAIEIKITDGESIIYPVQDEGASDFGPADKAIGVLLKKGLKPSAEGSYNIDYRVSKKAGNEIQTDSCVVYIETALLQEVKPETISDK